MFVRRTVTRRTEGRIYYTHRLVRSERDGEKVRCSTSAPGSSPCLAAVSASRRFGQAPLLEDTPAEVEREAQRIGAQLQGGGCRS